MILRVQQHVGVHWGAGRSQRLAGEWQGCMWEHREQRMMGVWDAMCVSELSGPTGRPRLNGRGG